MALVALVLVVAAALPATRDLFADRRVDETSVAALLYATLVRIPFGTVALEETLFRGVLLGLAMKLGSTRRAVVASCLLFGIWHTLPARGLAAANPTAVTVSAGLGGEVLAVALAVGAAALAGLPFCWLRLRSRSLLAPVMAHIATNSFGYAVAWVTLRALSG